MMVLTPEEQRTLHELRIREAVRELGPQVTMALVQAEALLYYGRRSKAVQYTEESR